MCTVSIVPAGEGFCLTCNRDERITRAVADVPRRRSIDGVETIFPTDSQRGGTWVGVNEFGIAIALLNRSARPRHDVTIDADSRRTRGELIPRLLAARDRTGLVTVLDSIDATAYAPFRVVVVDQRELLVATGDGVRMTTTRSRIVAPIAFTSSSLGDDIAERMRLPLFDVLVARARRPLEQQQTFHHHQWASCPMFSVRMQRFDARTVSRTIIRLPGRLAARSKVLPRLDYESL